MIKQFTEPFYHVVVKVLPGTSYYEEILEKHIYLSIPAYGVNEYDELVYPNPLTGKIVSVTDELDSLEFVRVADSSAIYAELQVNVFYATQGTSDDDEDEDTGLFGGLL